MLAEKRAQARCFARDYHMGWIDNIHQIGHHQPHRPRRPVAINEHLRDHLIGNCNRLSAFSIPGFSVMDEIQGGNGALAEIDEWRPSVCVGPG